MLEMALVENIQREDLDAVEVAISYQRLIEECKLTQETLSERVGKKRSTVANYLRLLKLPAEIQLAIRDRKITMGHARALINLANEKQQLQVCGKIIEKDLSVRAAEELVKKSQSGVEEKHEKDVNEGIPQEYQELKSHLKRHFGTNVDFKRSNKGSGKIVIPFKSDEDLERIIAILDKLNAE
jgi:ParB family chromosome partitioning protein